MTGPEMKIDELTPEAKKFYYEIDAHFFTDKELKLTPYAVAIVYKEIMRRNAGERRAEHIDSVDRGSWVDFFMQSWFSVQSQNGKAMFNICDASITRLKQPF
jgi:hypothetical protein